MRKSLLRTFAAVMVLVLVCAGSAVALRLEIGNVVVIADGGFTPKTLPKRGFAPIELRGCGRISTKDRTTPPALKTIALWFDRNGAVETRGLPVCTPAKLRATTTRTARRLCPGAIVGTGFGKAVVDFPDQPPIPAASPITIFNGARKRGNPTVLAHAHLTEPAPTTFVVPIEIQRVMDGRYGFKTVAQIPEIAGGSGTPVYGRLRIGHEWNYRGKRLSYANAGCPDGRLQAKGKFRFKGGIVLQGTLFQPCRGR